MPDKLLKLSAADQEDIVVLSTLLQDAVVPASEMIYLASEKRFALVAHRFCWEDAGEERIAGAIYERVRCGLIFEKVTGVRRKNFDQSKRGEILDLLALEATKEYVDLLFAGGATIRLEIGSVLCYAEDFGEAWPTQWRPGHGEDN
ncbi:MAG: DUF2948 family protein [Pseudomonadota bacterium]|nr:DUF2948 family protein [Pseudomonadota bacterium]